MLTHSPHSLTSHYSPQQLTIEPSNHTTPTPTHLPTHTKAREPDTRADTDKAHPHTNPPANLYPAQPPAELARHIHCPHSVPSNHRIRQSIHTCNASNQGWDLR